MSVSSTPQDDVATARTRWTITLAAAFGWFFDGYVITIYALTIPLIALEFHVSTAVLGGTVGSIFLIGYTIGTIGFGVSGDAFGRRLMLGVSIFGYGLVTALTALAQGVGLLAVFRFLTGVGGGGELSIGSPYVTEVWGPKRRGFGIGTMYIFYPLGYLFSVVVFMLLTPIWGWRGVYVFAVVPALAILALRLKLEESPRFNKVLEELRHTQGQRVSIFAAMRDPQYRYRMFVGFLIFVSLTYGYYAMAFYVPAYVVQHYGLAAARGAAVVVMIFQTGGLVGGFLGGVFGDRFGRRFPAILLAIIGILVTFVWWSQIWPLPVFVALATLGGFVLGFEWTLGIVYVNELFPTEIRASGFGWSAGLGRIVSIAAPIVTQILATSFGVGHAIQVSSFIWLFLIVGYLISHETSGVEVADRVALGTASPPALSAVRLRSE